MRVCYVRHPRTRPAVARPRCCSWARALPDWPAVGSGGWDRRYHRVRRAYPPSPAFSQSTQQFSKWSCLKNQCRLVDPPSTSHRRPSWQCPRRSLCRSSWSDDHPAETDCLPLNCWGSRCAVDSVAPDSGPRRHSSKSPIRSCRVSAAPNRPGRADEWTGSQLLPWWRPKDNVYISMRNYMCNSMIFSIMRRTSLKHVK